MTYAPPKFRSDLTISRQETAEEAFFIVRDPLSYEFFRFREPEQFIAQQLDGETSLEVIRQQTEEKFGGELSVETLNAFIKKLQKSGLLETDEGPHNRPAGRRGRLRGSLLYLRFKILDPNQFFDRLVRRARFFFTPYFTVLSAALILLAGGTTIASWSGIIQSLPRLYRLSAIPLFLAVIFLAACAHEFAHGLTCKYFGGEVHELGFMLIYFQPACYCNVSDAWLFPEKSKRLWVGFAGPYFELFLWALATLAWRLTDARTWTNYLALIVMISSGVKTLFNFNPFIKLDGYYLLSDYLEIPNLRRKSRRYVGGPIEKLFGLKRKTAREVSRRERRICATYGVLATLATFSLLGCVLVAAGRFRFAPWWAGAALLSVAVVGMSFRRPIRKLLAKSSRAADQSDDDEFETSNASEPPVSRRSEDEEKCAVEPANRVRTATVGAFPAADFGDDHKPMLNSHCELTKAALAHRSPRGPATE